MISAKARFNTDSDTASCCASAAIDNGASRWSYILSRQRLTSSLAWFDMMQGTTSAETRELCRNGRNGYFACGASTQARGRRQKTAGDAFSGHTAGSAGCQYSS